MKKNAAIWKGRGKKRFVCGDKKWNWNYSLVKINFRRFDWAAAKDWQHWLHTLSLLKCSLAVRFPTTKKNPCKWENWFRFYVATWQRFSMSLLCWLGLVFCCFLVWRSYGICLCENWIYFAWNHASIYRLKVIFIGMLAQVWPWWLHSFNSMQLLTGRTQCNYCTRGEQKRKTIYK